MERTLLLRCCRTEFQMFGDTQMCTKGQHKVEQRGRWSV